MVVFTFKFVAPITEEEIENVVSDPGSAVQSIMLQKYKDKAWMDGNEKYLAVIDQMAYPSKDNRTWVFRCEWKAQRPAEAL